jgi:hypothetical protein
MLLVLRQLLQEKNLPRPVQEELSVFSGGTLHHVGQLLAHRLMFNATLVVSPNGRHLQRLLLAGSCLADILNGECWLQRLEIVTVLASMWKGLFNTVLLVR